MGYNELERSLLSQPEFIAAARDFVRVRLNAKEDAENTALARRVSSHVDEVGFFLLDPRGDEVLLSRAPRTICGFLKERGGPAGIARIMGEIAARHVPGPGAEDGPVAWMKSLREALIQAHCDGESMLVLVGDDSAESARLARVAESDEVRSWRSRCYFARVAGDSTEREACGLPKAPALAFVRPVRLGTAGKRLTARIDPAAGLATALEEFHALLEPVDLRQACAMAGQEQLKWQSWVQKSTACR